MRVEKYKGAGSRDTYGIEVLRVGMQVATGLKGVNIRPIRLTIHGQFVWHLD